MEGDVLYLCLEDTFCRIQDRLFRLTDEASGRLHFAVASCKLSDGLIVQLEDYLKDYPDSRLIVIDTLQKVRTASKDNAYASDYGDISLIKDFADRHSLAVVVVHHIRKQNDSDVFNLSLIHILLLVHCPSYNRFRCITFWDQWFPNRRFDKCLIIRVFL